MNSIKTIRSIVTSANDSLETAVSGVPSELVNQAQPGLSNTIGAIYAHAAINLDMFFIGAIQGKPHLFEADRFGEQLGIDDPTNHGWDVLNATSLDLATLQTYAQAVYDEVNKYLDDLSDEELGRVCEIFGREMTVEEIIALTTWHTALHAGEIAALKGVQGVQGLPF